MPILTESHLGGCVLYWMLPVGVEVSGGIPTGCVGLNYPIPNISYISIGRRRLPLCELADRLTRLLKGVVRIARPPFLKCIIGGGRGAPKAWRVVFRSLALPRPWIDPGEAPKFRFPETRTTSILSPFGGLRNTTNAYNFGKQPTYSL